MPDIHLTNIVHYNPVSYITFRPLDSFKSFLWYISLPILAVLWLLSMLITVGYKSYNLPVLTGYTTCKTCGSIQQHRVTREQITWHGSLLFFIRENGSWDITCSECNAIFGLNQKEKQELIQYAKLDVKDSNLWFNIFGIYPIWLFIILVIVSH
jgi:hypothetical protein